MSDRAASRGLSHLDSDGRARMVDVGAKPVTRRTATATGRLVTRPDVLDFDFTADSILVTATVKTTGQTGVEMEALTAVTIAALTLHDMIKAVDAAATITDVQLRDKTGGKHGHWVRPRTESITTIRTGDAGTDDAAPAPSKRPRRSRPRAATAAVIVASTAAAAGEREDTTGPLIAEWLTAAGYAVDAVTVVSDAQVATELARVLKSAPAVILTTGGTGTSPSDRTPEATLAVIDRELPGIAEAMRARGLSSTPTAALSRAVAGTARGTIIVNLPGSPGGVRDGLDVLDGVLGHLVAQVAGGGPHG